MTHAEWSKEFRTTRDAMRDAAVQIAEAVETGYTPDKTLVAQFTKARKAFDAIVRVKAEYP